MASRSAIVKLDWTYAATLLGRLCLSAIFLISGVGKLMSPKATVAAIDAAGLPFPELSLALAIGIELGCGLALLAGFKVQWAAGLLALFSLATAAFFHADFADPNQFTHFLKNIAIAGGLLYVIVPGRDAGR